MSALARAGKEEAIMTIVHKLPVFSLFLVPSW
jgi:hypothetical protein